MPVVGLGTSEDFTPRTRCKSGITLGFDVPMTTFFTAVRRAYEVEEYNVRDVSEVSIGVTQSEWRY